MRPALMRRASPSSVRMASEVTVPDLLKQTEQLKLLSTASKLGLLSKLEAAGLTLKDVEKLLPLVDENDLIGLAKGFGPDLLKVAPVALKAAPAALPLLATALTVPGEALFVGAAASFAAGAGLVYLLPDESLTGVALETFLAVPLLFVLPAVLGGGGLALSALKSGKLVNLLASISPAPSAQVAAAPVEIAVSGPVAAVKKSSPSKSSPSKSSGRPTAVSGGGRPAAGPKAPKAKAAPRPAPKKAAPKPAPKPKPVGNISNLPKAL
eukprot:jgi/Undpi1/2736/HiC_scaffold_14.g06114.m1